MKYEDDHENLHCRKPELEFSIDAWWKQVDEQGKTDDGRWAVTDILSENNSIYTFTIPENMQEGQYIIRHEMCVILSPGLKCRASFVNSFTSSIALHGAQLYSSCIQVKVTGDGT